MCWTYWIKGTEAIPFDLCIIDEASKDDTETLVPLASSRRWILVGDERQLPPFVDNTLESAATLKRFDLTREQLSETLFTVLADACRKPKFSLTHQHRMHPQSVDL